VRRFSLNGVRIVKLVKKNKEIALFLCSQCCALKAVHKKERYPLFFEDFNDLPTILTRIVSVFQFSIQKQIPEKCRSIGVVFRVCNQTLAPVRTTLVGFQRFALHFDENCLKNLNIFSKSKSNYRSSNSDNFRVRH
jgi:hypothetical protein